MHIRVGASPDFAYPVLLVPCAAEKEGVLSIAIDPRYDQYDIAKFYKYHIQKGDLAVCIQDNGKVERLLLTINR